ncbi:hypothetical protein C8D88_116185 [Lentzea atacamensis]|jgi:hypothetical protein|uniref:Uncharacterized protein n=1 Tax=Lentzea atacamensis TaxID=531938 RepID=A0A316HU10_9PSEU|nr:hypothetical protein [Lentzea atacamensis]PWK81772.1 hypothetical protein C8D88_116185 [Lentzea atacamensis]RAS62976.1 hypothetical protein C8D87_107124 [Lentzea atacamensis]
MQVFVDANGGRRVIARLVSLTVASGLMVFAAVVGGTLLEVW